MQKHLFRITQLIFLIVFSNSLMSQDSLLLVKQDSVLLQIELIKDDIKLKSDKLLLLESEARVLKARISMARNHDTSKLYPLYIQTTVKRKSNLVEKPEFPSDPIIELNKNDSIILLDSNEHYWRAKAKDIYGYINKAFVYSPTYLEMEEAKKVQDKKDIAKVTEDIEKSARLYKEKRKKRRDLLVNALGTKIGNRIVNREIWLGMSGDLARLSQGIPDDINKSVGSWGVHEQWVYNSKDLYLYFENGKLTSWQK